METNNFRGELTDLSAKNEALTYERDARVQKADRIHPNAQKERFLSGSLNLGFQGSLNLADHGSYSIRVTCCIVYIEDQIALHCARGMAKHRCSHFQSSTRPCSGAFILALLYFRQHQ